MTSHSAAKNTARLLFANWMATIPEACEICRKREERSTPEGFFWGVIYPGPEIIDFLGGPIVMALPEYMYERLADAGCIERDIAPYQKEGPYQGLDEKLNYTLQRAHEMLRDG